MSAAAHRQTSPQHSSQLASGQHSRGGSIGSLAMLAQHAKLDTTSGPRRTGAASDLPLLQLQVAGRSLTLRPGLTYTLGCGPSAHVQLPGAGVEPRHAQIHNNQLRVLYISSPVQQQQGQQPQLASQQVLSSLGRSGLGGPSTLLNGREVQVGQAAPLRHGDEIIIGTHSIRVQQMDGPDSTQMQHERDTGIHQTSDVGMTQQQPHLGQQHQQQYIPDKERDSAPYAGEKGLGLAPNSNNNYNNYNEQRFDKGGIIEQQQQQQPYQSGTTGQSLAQTGAGLAGAGAAYHQGREQQQFHGTGERPQQPLAIVDRTSGGDQQGMIREQHMGQRGIDQQQQHNPSALLERAGIAHHGSGHPGAGHQNIAEDRSGLGAQSHLAGQGSGIDHQQRTSMGQSGVMLSPLGVDQPQQQQQQQYNNYGLQSNQQPIGQRGMIEQNQSSGGAGQSLNQVGAGLVGNSAAYHDGHIPPSEQNLLRGGSTTTHNTSSTRDGNYSQQQHYDQSGHTTQSKPGLMERMGLSHHDNRTGTMDHNRTGTMDNNRTGTIDNNRTSNMDHTRSGQNLDGTTGLDRDRQLNHQDHTRLSQNSDGSSGLDRDRQLHNQDHHTRDHSSSKPGLMERMGLTHHDHNNRGPTHTDSNVMSEREQERLGQGGIASGVLSQSRGGQQAPLQSGINDRTTTTTAATTGATTGGATTLSDVDRDRTTDLTSSSNRTTASGPEQMGLERMEPSSTTTSGSRDVGIGSGLTTGFGSGSTSTTGSGSGSYMLAPSYSTSQLATIFGDMVDLSGSRLSEGAGRTLPHWFNLFPSGARQELNSSHLKLWLQKAKEERAIRLAGDGGDGVNQQQQQQQQSSVVNQPPSASQAAAALCSTPSTDRNELTESDFVFGLLAMQAAGDIGRGSNGSGVDEATRGVNSLGLQSSSGWTETSRQSGPSVGGLGSGSHAETDYALLTLLSDLCEVGGWQLGGGWESAVRYMLDSKHCAPQRRQGIHSHLKQWIKGAIADKQRTQQLPGNSDSGISGGNQILSPLNLAHGLISTHGL